MHSATIGWKEHCAACAPPMVLQKSVEGTMESLCCGDISSELVFMSTVLGAGAKAEDGLLLFLQFIKS